MSVNKRNPNPYVTVRKLFGSFIGDRILDITQQDEDDFKRDGEAFIQFFFESGRAIKVVIGEDGEIEVDEP